MSNSTDPAAFGDPSFAPKLPAINSTPIGNQAICVNNNTGSGVQVFVSADLGGGIANYLGGITDISNMHVHLRHPHTECKNVFG